MSFADLQMSAPAGGMCGVYENMSVDRYVACVAASCKPRLLNNAATSRNNRGADYRTNLEL
jgi:hypothetical protein